MSDIARRTMSELSKSDSPVSKEIGGALVKTGVGAGVLWIGAAALPFINFPMLLVLAVVLGGYLYIK